MVISFPQRANSPILSPILSEWNTRLLMETTPEIRVQIQLKPFRSKPFHRVFFASPNTFRSLLAGNCIYEPKEISMPVPIQSICTKWGSDPFSFGSYSHVCVQSSGSDYDILTENLGGRLFFSWIGYYSTTCSHHAWRLFEWLKKNFSHFPIHESNVKQSKENCIKECWTKQWCIGKVVQRARSSIREVLICIWSPHLWF